MKEFVLLLAKCGRKMMVNDVNIVLIVGTVVPFYYNHEINALMRCK